MNEKRYTTYIGSSYDMIVDNQTGKSYEAIYVADMLNKYDEEVRKLSNALMKAIEAQLELKQEIKRLGHEVYGK